MLMTSCLLLKMLEYSVKLREIYEALLDERSRWGILCPLLEIHRDRSHGMGSLSQRPYVDGVFIRFNIHSFLPRESPTVRDDKFVKSQCPKI